MNQETDVLTRKQAAAIIQVCVTTLDRITDLPRFKIRRAVRFRRADLDKWLERQAAQAQGVV
jgi:predicted DNA-binding transcriptional regulator AlpA